MGDTSSNRNTAERLHCGIAEFTLSFESSSGPLDDEPAVRVKSQARAFKIR